MSYYERLQKVIGEQEGGTGKVQQAIDLAKEKDQADFQETQSKEQAILPAELNKFGEEFGIKMASKLFLKKAVAPLVKRQVQAGREALDARGVEAEGKIADLGKEAGQIYDTAGQRMAIGQPVTETTDVAGGTGITATTGDAGMFGTNAGRVTNDMTIGARTAPTQETEVGRRLPADEEGDMGTAESGGLTQAETARLAGIDTETSTAADTIAEAGARTAGEVALDAVPVVGEIAMMAGMFGGMIHSAHKAHMEQMADETTERTDLQNVQSAQMYSGFNRPNFGSMALPSFDTSKNPTMLQE
tara:strand:+ start:1372 stop:2277 length:906 start_codon:yes stop_codon:yes gene_type:complete